MLVFPRKEKDQAMIITIILAELDPETASISVVTDLDTWVGSDLPVFQVIAAATSALAGHHPAFLQPVLPVESLLDPEPDAAVLFEPEELAASPEAGEPYVDDAADVPIVPTTAANDHGWWPMRICVQGPEWPAFEKSVKSLLSWRDQIPADIADDATIMGRWSGYTPTVGDVRRLAKAFERTTT